MTRRQLDIVDRLHSVVGHRIHCTLHACSGILVVPCHLQDILDRCYELLSLLQEEVEPLLLAPRVVGTFGDDNNRVGFWFAVNIAFVSDVARESCMYIELHVVASLSTFFYCCSSKYVTLR